MKLYLKKWAPEPVLNNTFYDDSGRTIYKVHTPWKFTRTTTITKFLPLGSSSNTQELYSASTLLTPEHFNSGTNNNSEPKRFPDNNESEEETQSDPEASADLGSTFIYLAQIDWKITKSSVIRFEDGRELEVAKYLRRDEWRKRVFTASDGVEYRWIMGWADLKLFKNTPSKDPIATLHPSKLGLFKSKRTPAYLEIHPAGYHIVDEIFITFIYMEKIRQDPESSRKTTDDKKYASVTTDLDVDRERHDAEPVVKNGDGKKAVSTDLDDSIYRDPRLL